MTTISHDLTGKIDAGTAAILSIIDRVAAELNLDFFIVGALARDIILAYLNDIFTPRATLDIDIAVSVKDWDQFQELKNTLVATGKFVPANLSQRLMYERDMPVDILTEQSRAPQGHQIVIDIIRQIGFRQFSYDRVLEFFDALRNGLSDG